MPIVGAGVETIYVVDADPTSHMLVRQLAQSLGVQCKDFPDARSFLRDYVASSRGCIVLNVAMPDLDGLALQQELTRSGSTLPIIFVAFDGEVRAAVEAMRHGAFNFLQKPLSISELAASVQRALDFDRHNRQTLAHSYAIREKLMSLTPREREVLDLVSRGEPNKVIASNLQVSERSVEFHRSRGMEKMGAGSVAQLVRMLVHVEEAASGYRRL